MLSQKIFQARILTKYLLISTYHENLIMRHIVCVLNIPLRSWKAGRLLFVSLLLTVRAIVTCGCRVSRASQHYTLPAFQNLHGSVKSQKGLNELEHLALRTLRYCRRFRQKHSEISLISGLRRIAVRCTKKFLLGVPF